MSKTKQKSGKTKDGRRADPKPATRLMLVSRPQGDIEAELARVEAALGAGDIAAVLLYPPEVDERGAIRTLRAFAGPVQAAGAALLVAERFDLVARAGADGAHMAGDPAEALDALKPERIVGIGGLESRHAAMEAGEGGIDYVMFGEPDGSGDGLPFDLVLERTGWWAEVFEIPCIGYARDLAQAAGLAAAGADFVAVPMALLGTDPAGVMAALATALQGEPVA
jgi:thiamine-phosphate pyrophosphorylase